MDTPKSKAKRSATAPRDVPCCNCWIVIFFLALTCIVGVFAFASVRSTEIKVKCNPHTRSPYTVCQNKTRMCEEAETRLEVCGGYIKHDCAYIVQLCTYRHAAGLLEAKDTIGAVVAHVTSVIHIVHRFFEEETRVPMFQSLANALSGQQSEQLLFISRMKWGLALVLISAACAVLIIPIGMCCCGCGRRDFRRCCNSGLNCALRTVEANPADLTIKAGLKYATTITAVDSDSDSEPELDHEERPSSASRRRHQSTSHKREHSRSRQRAATSQPAMQIPERQPRVLREPEMYEQVHVPGSRHTLFVSQMPPHAAATGPAPVPVAAPPAPAPPVVTVSPPPPPPPSAHTFQSLGLAASAGLSADNTSSPPCMVWGDGNNDVEREIEEERKAALERVALLSQYRDAFSEHKRKYAEQQALKQGPAVKRQRVVYLGHTTS